MRRSSMLGLVLVVAFATTGCSGGNGAISVSEVRVGQPTGPNAAMYLTVTNDGEEPDRLLGATTEVAGSVQIHETLMGGDGTMSMQPVDGIDVAPGETVVLEPGGLHLMLLDARSMEVGDTVEVTLTWEQAGEMTVEAEVVDPADTMGHDDHGG